MKKALLLVIALMSYFGVVSVSHSGLKLTIPVSVTATSILGSFGSTRNSANNVEYLYYFDYGTSVTVYAQDSASTLASCSTSNPSHMSIIRGGVDSSYFYVTFDSTGQCTTIYNGNGSLLEPKVQ